MCRVSDLGNLTKQTQPTLAVGGYMSGASGCVTYLDPTFFGILNMASLYVLRNVSYLGAGTLNPKPYT